MADKKISQFPTVTTVNPTDILPIVTGATETDKILFSDFENAIDIGNLGGSISVNQINGGVDASINTFLRGDGTWATVPGGGGGGAVDSVNGQTGVVTLDSDSIPQGVTNLYLTTANFNSLFALRTTTNLSEGTNLYYTAARFNTAFAAKSTTDLTEGTNLYYTAARFNTAFSAKTTDNLTEGSTNKYFTSANFTTEIALHTTDELPQGSTNKYNQSHTGDVTGSTALTIANNAVTLAKMATVATASFLGRNTAGTGNVEVLSVSTVKTLLGLTGTNSGDVTVSGENYLSLAGQAITANAVNLSGTNVTGTLAAARFPALSGAVTTSAGSLVTTLSSGIDATKIADGSVSNTEFQYLDGLTGNIQSQIDSITLTDGDYGDITVSSGGTVWTIDSGLNANKIGAGTVSNTEFGYLDGVTSALQTQLDGKVNLTGNETIAGVKTFSSIPILPNTDPTTANEATRKSYVDAIAAGINPNLTRLPCRVASSTNISITTGLENGDTVNGVVVATGDRVLLFGQTAPAENGIYVVVASGTASRATDSDTAGEVAQGTSTYVTSGTNMGLYFQQNVITTLGTDPLSYAFVGSPINYVFAPGTAGTDFAISTVGVNVTFNLPVASASNTGKLSSTDWTTFNNKTTGPSSAVNGRIATFNGTTGKLLQDSLWVADPAGTMYWSTNLSYFDGGVTGDIPGIYGEHGVYLTMGDGFLKIKDNTLLETSIDLGNLSSSRSNQMPNADGTFALSVNGVFADGAGDITLTVADVVGAGDVFSSETSTTDGTIVAFDSTSGKLIKNTTLRWQNTGSTALVTTTQELDIRGSQIHFLTTGTSSGYIFEANSNFSGTGTGFTFYAGLGQGATGGAQAFMTGGSATKGGTHTFVGGDGPNGGDFIINPGIGGSNDGHFILGNQANGVNVIFDTSLLTADRTQAYPDADGTFLLDTTLTVDLATQATGTLGINHGGTGQTTANAALNALLPTQTGNSGKALVTNGTDASWSSPSITSSKMRRDVWVFPDNVIDPTSDITSNQFYAIKALWYEINSSGVLVKRDTSAFGSNFYYTAANALLVRQNSTEQYVTFTTGSKTNLGTMTADSTKRANATLALRQFCIDNGFTGVELDTEVFSIGTGATAPQYANFKTWIQELGTDLHNYGFKLIIDGPPIWNSTTSSTANEWTSRNSQGYYTFKYEDFDALPVDYLLPLAYDYQFDIGAGSPNSPLAWQDDIATWTRSKITNKNRVMIGLPSAGYSGTTGGFSITGRPYSYLSVQTGFNTASRDSASGELIWANAGTSYAALDDTTLNTKIARAGSESINRVSIWYAGGSNKYGTGNFQFSVDPSATTSISTGSGGAPTTASYLTLATDASLSNERVLTGTANQVILTDNGAGNTLVLSLPQDIATASTPRFANLGIGGVASAGTGILVSGTGYANNLIAATGSISPAAGTNGTLYRIAGTIVEAASGNHNLFSAMFIGQTTVTAAAATVSNTASIYIENAMSATVSGKNYAIWSDDGINRFDGIFNASGTDLSANQVWGANAAGTGMEGKNLAQGTGVTITNAAGSVTFAIGQAVATSSTPQFAKIGIGTAASTELLSVGASTTALASIKVIPGVDPTTPIEGDMWNSTAQRTQFTYIGGLKGATDRTIFTATASTAAITSTSETSLLGTGVGTKTIPVNYLVAGKKISVKVFIASISTSATPGTLTLKAKFGATTVLTTTFTPQVSQTNAGIVYEFEMTCRTTGATGTVFAYARADMYGTSLSNYASNATVTVDTTTASLLDVTLTWATGAVNSAVGADVLIRSLN